MSKIFCLKKEYAVRLIAAIKDDSSFAEKLMFEYDGDVVSTDSSGAEIRRTNESRMKFLSEFVGKDDLFEVNTLIQEKLLNKAWKGSVIRVIEKMAGMHPPAKKDLISRINRMEKFLTPLEEDAVFEKIASKKLGTDVTIEEIKNITSMVKEINELSEVYNKSLTMEDRKKLGVKKLILHKYLTRINPENQSVVAQAIGLPRLLMTIGEMSAPLRQGLGLIGSKHFWNAIPRMHKHFWQGLSENFRDKEGNLSLSVPLGGGDNNVGSYTDYQAELITAHDYSDMKDSKLAVSILAENMTQVEEDFTATFIRNESRLDSVFNSEITSSGGKLASILPKLLGSIVKASEYSYVGFLTEIRVQKFRELRILADKNGEDVSSGSPVLKDIAEIVNMLTGAGNIGKHDRYAAAAPLIGKVFFSARKNAAMLQMFNPYTYMDPKVSPTARTEGFKNLTYYILVVSSILGLVGALDAMDGEDDDMVEIDPRSSDFGKIKIGNSRFDISGGNAGYLTLIARLAPFSRRIKSSSDGTFKSLGGGFGSTQGDDLFYRFVSNKFSPIASLGISLFSGKDFEGNDIKIGKELISRMYPLYLQSIVEMAKDDEGMANILLAMSGGMYGVGASSYGGDNKSTIIKTAYLEYGGKSKEKALNDIYKNLEEANDSKLSGSQKTNIKKEYSLYTSFGDDDKAMRHSLQVLRMSSNAERAEYLKKLKEKDRALYNLIIKNGRKTIRTSAGNNSPILISDDLYDKLK